MTSLEKTMGLRSIQHNYYTIYGLCLIFHPKIIVNNYFPSPKPPACASIMGVPTGSPSHNPKSSAAVLVNPLPTGSPGFFTMPPGELRNNYYILKTTIRGSGRRSQIFTEGLVQFRENQSRLWTVKHILVEKKNFPKYSPH